MSVKYYKIFFTITFTYKIGPKKKVAKSFKSDIDINSNSFDNKINDEIVKEKWTHFALKKSVNLLNPPSNFDDDKISEKKIIIHRIVNLTNLTEVF